jgi:hypothetical protein
MQSSYDLTSYLSPILATLSTSVIGGKPSPRLHSSKINWNTYRQIIRDKVNLSMKLKEHKDIELETNSLLNLSSMLPKELPQTATLKEQQITYPTKLKD